MKTFSSVHTRRDRCYLFARRAVRLTPPQAAEAWYKLSEMIEELGAKDIPRFNDLLIAFRVATVRQAPGFIPLAKAAAKRNAARRDPTDLSVTSDPC